MTATFNSAEKARISDSGMNVWAEPSLHPNIHTHRQDFKKRKTKNHQINTVPLQNTYKKNYSYPKNLKSWLDKVCVSAFPYHLIPHENMPGQHAKRLGTQNLKNTVKCVLPWIFFCAIEVICVFSLWWRKMGREREGPGDLPVVRRRKAEVWMSPWQPDPKALAHCKIPILFLKTRSREHVSNLQHSLSLSLLC